jgi:hypothetical protein
VVVKLRMARRVGIPDAQLDQPHADLVLVVPVARRRFLGVGVEVVVAAAIDRAYP